jgi:regulatory protein
MAADRDSGRRQRGSAAAEALASDPVSYGREICLRALTVAPRSRGELATAMRRKGVPVEAADQVLSRLTGAGLIDDAAFAEAWVSSRHNSRGLGRRALAGELHRRGVEPALVRAALEQVDSDDEVVAATALVRRRLASTAGLPTATRVRRLCGMLARKGYSGGLAARVVRDALGDEAAALVEGPEGPLT